MKKVISFVLVSLMLVGLITFPNVSELKVNASSVPELYSCYNFDDSNATNLGSAKINGVFVGNPVFVTGRNGESDKALELDGTGNNLIKVDSNAFMPSGDFTVSVWAKMSSIDPLWGNGRIISNGVLDWNTPGILVGFNNNAEGWSNVISGIGGTGWGNFQWGDGLTPKNDDTWHHVAAVYNTTGKNIIIYVDGTVTSNYYYSSDESINTSIEYTAIGAYLDGDGNMNEPFKGLVDDISIIKKALSSDEVISLMADTLQTTIEPPLNALISTHYSFNSSSAKDVGNDYIDGELVGTPTFATGRQGGDDKAIELNGSNYVKVPASVFKPQGNFSISFWAQMETANPVYDSSSRVISTGLFGENVPGIMIGFNNNSGGWSNVISGIGGSGWGTFQWGDGNPSLVDNTWHNIITVFDTSNKVIKVYLDGVEKANYTYTDDSIDTAQLYTAIGGHLNGDETISESFKGKLDDVMVIKKALTVSDVSLVMEDRIGEIIDSVTLNDVRSFYSFNGRNANDSGLANIKGDLIGNPVFVKGRNGENDLAIELNGSNYIKFDSSIFEPSGNFTISFWAQMSSINPLFGEGRVISTGLWGENVPGIMIGFNNDSGGWSNVISGIGGSGWGTFQWGGSCSPLNDNVWHNVVGVYNTLDKNITVYLDGIVKASYSYSDDSIDTSQLFTAFGGHINEDGSLSSGFIGRLDDLMVVTRALPEEHVVSIGNDTLITVPDNIGVREDRDMEVLTKLDFNNQDATNIGSCKLNGELVGNPTFIQGRNGSEDKAILLDGTNYIKLPTSAINVNNNFTVSFWAIMSSTTPLWGSGRIVTTGVWGWNTPGMLLGFNNDAGGWGNVITGIGGTEWGNFQWGNGNPAGTPFNDDIWHNVTGVYNVETKNVTIYLDGVVNADYSFTSLDSAISPYEFTAIGGFLNEDDSISESFVGAVDDVTVIKRALTPDQISSNIADTLVSPISFFGVDKLANNYISGIAVGTTVEGFKNLVNISSGAVVEFKSGSTILGNLDTIGSGTTLDVTLNGNTIQYLLVIFGDVSGDGNIDIADLAILKNHLLLISQLSGIYLQAGDLFLQDSISISNLLAVKKELLGISNINQYPIP